MPRLDGLDIHPTYQPVTNWDAIPQYPLMAVKATEGASTHTVGSKGYFAQFRRRNFKYRGVYHWIRSDSSIPAQVANLKRWWDSMDGMQRGEFIQLDWETTPNIRNMTVQEIELWIVLAEKIWPGRICVYGADWVPGFREWRAKYPDYPIWYPQYNVNAQKPLIYKATIWQYTSTLPHVDGINRDGHIDGNQVLDWPTLDRLTDQVALQLPLPTVTNPQKDLDTVIIKREANNAHLKWNGFVLGRASGAESQTQIPVVMNDSALADLIGNNDVTGPNPFRDFDGYQDPFLAGEWDKRPQV
jgi:glycosyl hydrolase family 25